jgi:Glycosyl transferases group 1.
MVVSDVCGQHSDLIKENVNGFIYKQGNIKDLAIKIEKSFSLDTKKINEINKVNISNTHPQKAAKNIIEII